MLANPLRIRSSEDACGVRWSSTRHVSPTTSPQILSSSVVVCQLAWLTMSKHNFEKICAVLCYTMWGYCCPCTNMHACCSELKFTHMCTTPPILLLHIQLRVCSYFIFLREIKGYTGSFYKQVESTRKACAGAVFGVSCILQSTMCMGLEEMKANFHAWAMTRERSQFLIMLRAPSVTLGKLLLFWF